MGERCPKFSLDPTFESPSCGKNLVAAVADQYPLEIAVADSDGIRILSNPGLQWDGSNWWVIGTLEGMTLTLGELRLCDITQTE